MPPPVSARIASRKCAGTTAARSQSNSMRTGEAKGGGCEGVRPAGRGWKTWTRGRRRRGAVSVGPSDRIGAGGAGSRRDAPASSIFRMISTLYTLLAHRRSLGRLGTSCSTSSYLTARRAMVGACGERLFDGVLGYIGVLGGRGRGRDGIRRAIRRRGWSAGVVRRRFTRGNRARMPGGRVARGRARRPDREKREIAGRIDLPATSRQHIATSWSEVLGTFTLLRTRSCG